MPSYGTRTPRFEGRLAGNYRSKRAFSQDSGGISGFEEYQAPTFFLDASASYNISPHIQVYVQGTNLTKERERYYLVWPDQVMPTGRLESRYTLGIRARFWRTTVTRHRCSSTLGE
jgi:hypothetical protein